MKKALIGFIFLLTLFNGNNNFKAQLVVTNTLNASQLASLISGPGVQILNPVVNAAGPNSYGKYIATSSNLNITEGLLLTTGTISNAIGPNNVGNKTTFFGNQYTPNTYTLLNSYTGKTTWEYTEFEFDIIPQGDTIKFDFVFASEEYEEWVGSQYNDVFGFFISGPGITGDPGAGIYHNIALLPNNTTAVTINNVNQNLNTQYYQNNNNGTSVQYDGFTKGLKAISKVTPCAMYHLKLVVADVSDKLWDSGVFIEKISSNNVLLLSKTAGGIPNMVEGCNNGTVIFQRPNVTSSPLTVNYWLGGTATNGTDYPLIGAAPSPTNMKTIVIPANQATVGLNINPFADAINEGTEYLTVYLGNPFCSNVVMDSLRFYIQDSLFTTVSPINDSICKGQTKQITTSGGGSAFSWVPTIGLSNPTSSNPIASPSVTTIYTLNTTASTCSMKKHVKINVSDIALSFTTTNVNCNGANNGAIQLGISNGFPTYTVQWSGPASFTSSSQNLSGLPPGTYTVNVTGKKSCVKTGTVSITEPSLMISSISSPTVGGGMNIACFGVNSGTAVTLASGGTAPYTYSWSTSPTQTNSTATNLLAGTYSVVIKDANNCSLTKTITLTQPAQVTATISNQTNVACFGNSTGAATISTSGGITPYTYSWTTSPAQSNSVATNLIAGTYSVTVKDGNNCSTTKTLNISQPAAALSANIATVTNVLCFGNSTGSASVSVNGGTAPYTYSWSTTPAQTSPAAVNLAAGSYNVLIKDNNNCTVNLPVTITQPATNVSANISAQTNVSCFGGNNGSATALASGGVPAYTYSWNTTPTQTNATAVNLTSGSYNVIIKDANNCSVSLNVNITQPAAALTASISSQSNVLCFNNNTGSATSAGSGGTPAYSYSWSTNPVQTSATAVNLNAGTYTVIIKDANNCIASKTVSISQPTSAVSAYISSHNSVLCYGASTASAAVSASGGVGGYTYLWNTIPSQITATASGLAAGNYTVTVKDANNCSVLTSVNITQPSSTLSGSITSVTPVLCKGNATGAASAIGIGGSGAYSYSWNSTPTQTTSNATSLVAGTYSVTISDKNGCTIPVVLQVIISEPAAILNASSTSPTFNGNNISCNGGNNGSINLSPTGGTSPYTFQWSGPSGYSSTNEDISSLFAGTYTVLITDANNCTKIYTTTLTEPTVLSVTGTVTPATCPAFNDGAVNITVSGGSTGYSYSWSGPSAFSSSSQNISGLIAGNYSLTVTDNNSCTKSLVFTVTQPGAIVITNTVSSYTGGYNVSCFGYNNGNIGAVNVTGGTPTYTYSWTGPNSYTASTANISSLYAGNYQLVVTDQNGCIQSKAVTLTQPAALTSTLTPQTYFGGYNITCKGASTGSISLSSSGGTPAYSYLWNGPVSYTSNSQNINGLIAGIYTITVSDVNSCTGTSTISLSEPNTLTITVASPTVAGGFNITCNGLNNGAINLNITGGTTAYTYTWSGPSSYSSTTQNPVNLAAGSYTVVIKDANNCITNNTINLTQPLPLTTSVSSGTVIGGYNITCFGQKNGSVILNVNGGTTAYSFAWTGINAFTSSSQNLSGIVAGSYSVQVTDANGCITYTSITLSQPALLTSTISSPVVGGGYNITCNGASNGSISLNASGGTTSYTYNWSGPASYTSTSQNPGGLIAGVYSAIITDANGCITTNSITLTEPALLVVNVNSPTYSGGYNISCNSYSNGAVFTTANGGTPTYTFSWSGPSSYTSNAQNPSGIGAGTYTLVVTDLNGCVNTKTINLTQPNGLVGAIASATFNGGYNVSCNGYTNGVVSQTIAGGTLPYSFNWNNNASTQNLINVGAGTYSVIITDANNCSISQSITLTQPNSLFASAISPVFNGGNNIKCFGGSTGSVTLGATGGTTPYNYLWNGPSSFTSNTQNLNNVIAGTYTNYLTDNNGCTYSLTITLNQPALLVAAISSPTFAGGYNLSCNNSGNGSVTSTVTGGTAAYSYLWNGPSSFTSSSTSISALPAGSYSLLVTDINNCTSSVSINLTQPNTLTATSTSTVYTGGFNVSCNGYNNGNINLNVNGGTAAYSYSWSGPSNYTSTTQNITNLNAGNYSVIITDANGCSFTLNKTLTEPASITNTFSPSLFVGGYNVSCNGASTGSASIVSNGGTSPYLTLWNGPSSFTSSSTTINGLFAGVYTVSVTDANTCIKTETIQLTEPSQISNTLTTSLYIGGFNIKCKGDSSGVIYNNITGGTPGYTLNWSGPGTFTSNTQNVYNVPAGSYTVSITDANGCIKTNSITLTEAPNALTGSLTLTSINCHNDKTGAITLTVTGGTPGYVYWWRGPNDFTSSLPNISNLHSGIYNLVVTDTNGCQVSIDTTLTEPADFTYTSSVISDPLCFGVSNGSINIVLTGGTTPYSFNWSNGATTEDIIGLNAGTYTLQLTDAKGCKDTAVFTLNQPQQALQLTKKITNVKCYGDTTGSINLIINGGTAPYTFNWSNGSTQQNLNAIKSASYIVTITDINGCKRIDTINVSQPDSLALTLTSPVKYDGHNISLQGGNDGAVNLTVNGGTIPYSYIWSNNANSKDLYGVSAGKYFVTVIDSNGCKVSGDIYLTEPLALQMPTAFSPNEDGKNDRFVIHGIEAYPNNSIIVFNRWGNIVYKNDGYKNDWDGHSNNGIELPDGTYFVILETDKGVKTQMILKGYVELRRY
ncbi:MAG: choice-of-anchor L domain-containing protein [Sphingobacteriaceae bacterium]